MTETGLNPFSDPELLARFSAATLEQLAPFAEVLGRKFREHRMTHNGYVPLELFKPWLALAGVYYCCDVVISVPDTHPCYLLKRRTAQEVNPRMVGKYQIVGAAGVDGWSAEQALTKSLVEIFGKDKPGLVDYHLRNQLDPLGAEIHPESWRDCTSLTLLFSLDLDIEDIDELIQSGKWEKFSDFDDPRIVAHQAETLRYLTSPVFKLGAFVTLPGTPD